MRAQFTRWTSRTSFFDEKGGACTFSDWEFTELVAAAIYTNEGSLSWAADYNNAYNMEPCMIFQFFCYLFVCAMSFCVYVASLLKCAISIGNAANKMQ